MLDGFKAALDDQREAVAESSPPGAAPGLPCSDVRVQKPEPGSVVHAHCVCEKHDPPALPSPPFPASESESLVIDDWLATYEGMEWVDEETQGATMRRKAQAAVNWGVGDEPRYNWQPPNVIPGRINFNTNRIQRAFTHHMGALHGGLTPKQKENLARIFLHSILFHELFHYFCDIQTHLTGAKAVEDYWRKDGKELRAGRIEEPLAVAFSHWRTGRDHDIGVGYVKDFVDVRFAYSGVPFYSEWKKYEGGKYLSWGLCDYLPEQKRRKAQLARGVDVADLLLRSIEPVIEAPNAALILWWPRPSTGTSA